jgi:hypothetical protein
MRYVFALWALPIGLFWGWYFLSLNDFSLGYAILSRPLHDMVFQLYGNILGVDPESIPSLVAKACVIDTLILLAILAFRRRRRIRTWFQARRERHQEGGTPSGPTPTQKASLRATGRARPAG